MISILISVVLGQCPGGTCSRPSVVVPVQLVPVQAVVPVQKPVAYNRRFKGKPWRNVAGKN
jgi:hypothetical protein